MNTGGPARHPGNPWHRVEAPNPSAPLSFRPDWPSRKGSLPEWGGDCLAGSRRHDQSLVPALPGCAMVIFTLDEGDVFGELGRPRTHEDLSIFTAQQI
jgi:hypothetical protein